MSRRLGGLRRLLSPLNLGAMACLVAIWSFTSAQLGEERDRLIHDAETRTRLEAQSFGEYSLGSARRLSEFLLDLRTSWLAGRDVFERVIRERQDVVRDLTFQVAVIDKDGLLLYSSIAPVTERVDLSQREHFRVHKEASGRDSLFISDPVQGKISKKWSIQFTRPILDAGRFAGVMVVSVSPEQFASFSNALAIGKDGAATIIKASGQVIARLPNPDLGIEKPPRVRHFNQPGSSESGSYRVVSGTDGVERIVGYHHVPEIGLYFLIGESDHAQVVAGAAQHRIHGITLRTFEPAPPQRAIAVHLSDNRFDGDASPDHRAPTARDAFARVRVVLANCAAYP